MSNNIKLILIGVITLAIGIVGGYYYGNLAGKKSGVAEGIETGRQQVLDEQKKAQEEELARVAKEANPFADIEEKANPFKDVYKNPFAQ